jgi:hypothetical protein
MKEKQKITNQDTGITNFDSIRNNDQENSLDEEKQETPINEKSGSGNEQRAENTTGIRKRNNQGVEPQS